MQQISVKRVVKNNRFFGLKFKSPIINIKLSTYDLTLKRAIYDLSPTLPVNSITTIFSPMWQAIGTLCEQIGVLNGCTKNECSQYPGVNVKVFRGIYFLYHIRKNKKKRFQFIFNS